MVSQHPACHETKSNRVCHEAAKHFYRFAAPRRVAGRDGIYVLKTPAACYRRTSKQPATSCQLHDEGCLAVGIGAVGLKRGGGTGAWAGGSPKKDAITAKKPHDIDFVNTEPPSSNARFQEHDLIKVAPRHVAPLASGLEFPR